MFDRISSYFLSVFEHRFFIPLFLLFMGYVAYANGMTGGFLLDDRINLLGQTGVEHKGFIDIFLTKHGDYYRPMANVPMWIFYQLFHKQVVYYHIGNLLVLWASACMSFVIISRLSGDRLLAFLSASFYIMHPTHALLVDCVVGTASASVVVCSQLSFLLFLSALEKKSAFWYVGSLLIFGLTFLTHEMAIVVLVPVLAYLFFIRREGPARIFLLSLPFFLVSAGYFFLRLKFFPASQISFGVMSAWHDPAAYFSTWAGLIGWYIGKMFYPDRIIFMHSVLFGVEHLLLKVLIFAVTVGGIAYLTAFRWKRGLYSFALVVFAAGLLPSLAACFTYYPVVRPFIEFHWFYLTSMGFYILISAAILALAKKSREAAVLAVIVIWVILASLAWRYNSQWQNEEKFCRYWLSVEDGNLTPYWGLGHALMEKGDCQGAVREFRRGIATLNTNNIYLLSDAGHCYDVLGDDQNAALFLNAALAQDVHFALTHHYVGLYWMKRGRFKDAEAAFKRSVEFDPKGSPSGEYLKGLKL